MHKKGWTMIEVSDSESDFIQLLRKIYDKADGKVWKGVTGPPDSPNFSNYRLWVELHVPEGHEGEFKITAVKPFQMSNSLEYSLNKGYFFVLKEQ